MNNPKITVLMSAYNSEKTIVLALESILSQTFEDFEIIIVNDGSTDKTLEIISSYKDKRIRIINNESNYGLIHSLNLGIKKANGDYVARMDADDIANPDRLLKQLNILEKQKDIDIVSSNVRMFSDKFKFIKKNTVSSASLEKLRTELLFQNRIFHPTVMIRSSLLKGYNYLSEHLYCEDYGLWQRLIKNHKFIIQDEILLNYRMTSSSITSISRKKMNLLFNSHINVYKTGLDNLGIDYKPEELKIHTEICLARKMSDFKFNLVEKEKWLRKLKTNLIHNEKIDRKFLSEIISDFMLFNCLKENDYLFHLNSSLIEIKMNKTRFILSKYKLKVVNIIKTIIW
ncbi:glycosyltransferase family 2 protein [Terribacillus saccharophilus]|uniref:glycosyltransferase family 2 protein n=1 Tax=Terribacillus saccharophilus TaxID=361277 RepID=UPI003D27FEB8